jgi:hypothetical protein
MRTPARQRFVGRQPTDQAEYVRQQPQRLAQQSSARPHEDQTHDQGEPDQYQGSDQTEGKVPPDGPGHSPGAGGSTRTPSGYVRNTL